MPPSAPPNVLIVRSDSFRPDSLGAYGNTRISTPHLDRLASRSVLFEQAYCAQPVCAPSRASFYTGLYPHTHGVCVNNIPLRPDVPTIAELLKPAGYTCGHIGLWHQGDELRPQRGFEDFWVSTEESYTTSHTAEGYSSYHHFLVSRGYTPSDRHLDSLTFSRSTSLRLPEDAGKPAFEAQEAIRFLDTHGSQPFLLVVDILEPHPPYFGPSDGTYDPAAMTLPPTWYAPPDDGMPARFQARRQSLATRNAHVPTNDEAGWQDLKARYWGLCTLVDRHAGRILSHLETLGLAGNTIVIFTADHGEMMGEHRMLAKAMPYEGSIQVPLLVHVPGITPRRVKTPVSQVALLPTLLDLAGVPAPAHLQSESLLPLLTHGDVAPDEAEVVVEWNGYERHAASVPEAKRPSLDDESFAFFAVDVRTIRRGRWKLSVHASGEHELYDLVADPGETHNLLYGDRLARALGAPAALDDLWRRLTAWQARTADTLSLPAPHPWGG